MIVNKQDSVVNGIRVPKLPKALLDPQPLRLIHTNDNNDVKINQILLSNNKTEPEKTDSKEKVLSIDSHINTNDLSEILENIRALKTTNQMDDCKVNLNVTILYRPVFNCSQKLQKENPDCGAVILSNDKLLEKLETGYKSYCDKAKSKKKLIDNLDEDSKLKNKEYNKFNFDTPTI